VKLIRAGATYADAAIGAGIDPRTFMTWMAKGREAISQGRETPFRHFHHAVELANLHIKSQLVGRVLKGTARDPRLALKVLERRFPNDWGLKIRIEDTTPDKPASPREALMKRLSAIADRQQRADAALRGVMRTDDQSLAEGANGNGVNGHGEDAGP